MMFIILIHNLKLNLNYNIYHQGRSLENYILYLIIFFIIILILVILFAYLAFIDMNIIIKKIKILNQNINKIKLKLTMKNGIS